MKGKHFILKYLIVLFCVITTLFSLFIPVFAEKESLIVGVPNDRCPIFYKDPDTGEPIGIGVDLMRVAAENAGYKASFQFIKEPNLKEALDNPEYDVLMPFGSAITSASGKPIIVTENLMQTPFTFVTIGNRELPEMKNLRVGMVKSLSGGIETLGQLYPDMEVVVYDDMSGSVESLRRNEVDALLHNSYIWSYVLQKPSYKDLAVQPTTVFSMDFRAGTLDTPEGHVVVDRLNAGIAEMDESLLQAVVLDYTSRSLYRYDFSDFIYQYGLIVLLIALLIAALVVIALQRRRVMRIRQEKKLHELIDYDQLTGAYSLIGFRKRVEELLHEHPDVPYLLSYNNIKNFKFINNSLGMEAGDEILKFWVKKSLASLTDIEAIGRVEADHFAVLQRSGGDEKLIESDKNICEPIRNFFIDQGKGTRVQLCSGIYVLTPEDYRNINVDRMLDFARVAEKRVHESRNDGFEFYNPEQWEKGSRAADIIGHLPIALQNGEIQVWYQPQVNYDTGEIIGAEALCRWNHEKLGWLRPAEFIPTLENSGQIYELDCFMWDKVCQDIQRWNQNGLHRFVSVNLSRCDLREDQNIPGHFLNLTQKYGLSTDQIRVEITETAYVEDPKLLIHNTVKLRDFGFQVEMDDFGSGYSSLHMLKEVPVDRIKLDLQFLSGAGDPERGRIIVSQMVTLVKMLGMNLIAEGVENVSQAKFLQSQGCSEMQGFYFYKPMTVEEFDKL